MNTPQHSHNDIGFFNSIRRVYGIEPTKLLKNWIKFKSRLSKVYNSNRFLLRCKSNGFIPSHLINYHRDLKFNNYTFVKKYNLLTINYHIDILNLFKI